MSQDHKILCGPLCRYHFMSYSVFCTTYLTLPNSLGNSRVRYAWPIHSSNTVLEILDCGENYQVFWSEEECEW